MNCWACSFQDLRENLTKSSRTLASERASLACVRRSSNRKMPSTGRDEDIDNLLGFLAADHFFFAQSPAFTRLEASNIWEKLSDELNSKIHHIYYGRIGIIQQRFAKHVEYATHCKLTYLMPNGFSIRN
ncbi:MAG: hypothetical protein CM15mP128_3020 [Methanobacteriota archaeon]|nr:MAG: hypothetical protein CM15mP128_3020 [Euryarchaeota archaeon]